MISMSTPALHTDPNSPLISEYKSFSYGTSEMLTGLSSQPFPEEFMEQGKKREHERGHQQGRRYGASNDGHF
jgi:hypothetical protein